MQQTQNRSVSSIIGAIIGGLCGLAGTLAVVLPGGKFQEGADKVAQVCEANGFRAYPETEKPAQEPSQQKDAGTAAPIFEPPRPPFTNGTRA